LVIETCYGSPIYRYELIISLLSPLYSIEKPINLYLLLRIDVDIKNHYKFYMLELLLHHLYNIINNIANGQET